MVAISNFHLVIRGALIAQTFDFVKAIPNKDCASDVLYEHKLRQIFRQMKQKAE